ncbi:class I SAM-dependent methyltransferase [Pseudonocardia sp. KRD291]|uniref:class I SAM-dependent methyltransferase n=1 Tax=Pseudonocardia sp. KRD291 TaxID=2792007 RepID=UPI001C4A63A9|nr:methyltransferase domain-containing protein [Pseudonocardia sp. KRD291]MBW0104947.1 methyltransferase domain-containing protein [Pseudonocardia sp. KRD291]
MDTPITTSPAATTSAGTASAGTSRAERRSFLARTLADPRRMGAVTPTGRAAAARMAAVVPDRGRPAVLELGAGTGVLSRAILARMPDGGRLVAVESDPALVEYLHRTSPQLEVAAADAAELERVLDEAGIDRADAVVCSLPLTVMTAVERRRVLSAAARRLTPAGAFVAITYRPAWAARGLRADMADVFGRVERTPTIWANVPPARLLLGRGPRPC